MSLKRGLARRAADPCGCAVQCGIPDVVIGAEVSPKEDLGLFEGDPFLMLSTFKYMWG